MKTRVLLALGITLSLSAFAQTNSQSTMVVEPMEHTPTFRVTVVSRNVQAINYKHRGGATKVDFAGTALMPTANGQAKVKSKKGYIEIEVEFGGLERPTTFGNEYLTYILWAISPEGRAVNLGEVLVGDNHRSKLDVTTDLQAFALVVTAEPYYAVRRPSNLVVLENSIRSDRVGASEDVDAKYELIDRGGYIPTGFKFDPLVLNAKLPLEFFEARNAVRIAQSAGSEKYAATSYQNAVRQMDEADAIATGKHKNKKSLIALSREVVQTAEDAREIAVKNIDEEDAETAPRGGLNREATSQNRADEESRRRSHAEATATDAVRQRNEANRQNLDAQAIAQQATDAQADAVRQRDEADHKNREAQITAQQAVGAQADAERDRNDAKELQLTAEADSERNRAAAVSSDT